MIETSYWDISEQTYRLIVLLIGIAAGTMAFVLKRSASREASTASRPTSSTGTDQVYLHALRGTASLLSVGILRFLLANSTPWTSSLSSWFEWPVPAPIRLSGIVIAGAGLTLFALSARALGKNLTGSIHPVSDGALVTTGPYAWIRHPYYTATFALLAGISLIAADLWIAIASSVLIIILVLRTPLEERLLIERYGDQYIAYQRRTRRFL